EHEAADARVGVADHNHAHYPYEAMLDIGGMTCENCARKVQNALNRLDGVWASVSISTHRASVLMKSAPDEALLRQAVQQAGYIVTNVEVKKNRKFR
ncbi:MAG: heavy-metal-associated domain-containing protein, partial [Clostridia bacterium]|nr:heavy-metal-associated domain-containing protein [Clostridia bacterium]